MKGEIDVVEFELDSHSGVGYDSEGLNRNEVNTEILLTSKKKRTDYPHYIYYGFMKKGISM